MDEMVNLTKKFIMVGMDDAMVSTEKKPIIGTQALATCTGIVIYCEKNKKAIVAHLSSDNYKETMNKVFELININKLNIFSLKYKIIYGGDRGEAAIERGVINYIKMQFRVSLVEEYDELLLDGVRFDVNTDSNEFAFDASSGKFVTDKVLFGANYYIVNNEEYTDNFNRTKHK